MSTVLRDHADPGYVSGNSLASFLFSVIKAISLVNYLCMWFAILVEFRQHIRHFVILLASSPGKRIENFDRVLVDDRG